ncbi:MAG: NUDIX domain-containing protein [Saccharofermentanales bacterium]
MEERKSSRAIIVKDDKVFLFQFHFANLQDERTIWVTPGGKVEKGEDYQDCLEREIYEELGINIICPEKPSYKREMVCVKSNGDEFLSVERYYVIYFDDDNEFSYENWTQAEKNLTKNACWWTRDDIEKSSDEFFTDRLNEILEEIIEHNLPDEPYEI